LKPNAKWFWPLGLIYGKKKPRGQKSRDTVSLMHCIFVQKRTAKVKINIRTVGFIKEIVASFEHVYVTKNRLRKRSFFSYVVLNAAIQ
jgi:hypothetical protein